jgi:hypothetical protein
MLNLLILKQTRKEKLFSRQFFSKFFLQESLDLFWVWIPIRVVPTAHKHYICTVVHVRLKASSVQRVAFEDLTQNRGLKKTMKINTFLSAILVIIFFVKKMVFNRNIHNALSCRQAVNMEFCTV